MTHAAPRRPFPIGNSTDRILNTMAIAFFVVEFQFIILETIGAGGATAAAATAATTAATATTNGQMDDSDF